MKISCQSCQAKYTIADEKVLGKIVKIRCKKCGATIVINGNDPEAAASSFSGSQDANQVLDYTGSSNEQWTVNVAEGDQRTMTLAEITQEYRAGVVNDETFCWKDGMNDWLPIREIEALYAACTMGPAPALQAQSDFTPASSRGGGFDAGHDDHDSGFGGGIFGGGAAAESNGNGAALFGNSTPPPGSSASPSVARRSGGRGNNQADLFGTAAQAGGEDDVMTSAPVGHPPPVGDASKLTGQRNENSVLFSLNALTTKGPKNEPPPNQTTAKGDGSGLIDIRALSNAASASDSNGPKTSKAVDDIMNLGGGGAFSAALAAPILAPPATDTGSEYGAPQQTSNKTILYAIIGGCALLAVAIIVVAIIVTGSKSKSDDVATTPTGTAPTAAPTASTAAAPTDTAAATPPSSTAAAPGTGAAVAARPAGTGGGAPRGPRPSTGNPTAANDTPPATPPPPARPKDLAGAMNDAVGNKDPSPPPAAPTGGTAPFDRGAAAGSLGGVNVASCKKSDGPTGSGHVKVTFQPNGNVSTVEVDQPPFQGSSVGGCVAGKFRSAHVPPFAGGPVTVGKSFSIN